MAVELLIDEGKLVAVKFGCGETPEQLVESEQLEDVIVVPGIKPCAPLTAACEALVTGVVNVRSAPSKQADVVGQLSNDDTVCVTGPSALADGFRWWPIIAPDGIEGWAAEGDPQPAKPWLTPIGENC